MRTIRHGAGHRRSIALPTAACLGVLLAAAAAPAQSVHFEPDEHPDERDWRDLEELLGEHPARVMLWEAPPLPT